MPTASTKASALRAERTRRAGSWRKCAPAPLEQRGPVQRRATGSSIPRSPTRYSAISSLFALPRCLTTQRKRASRLPTRSLPMTTMVLATAPISPAATLRAMRCSSWVSSVVTSRSVVTRV